MTRAQDRAHTENLLGAVALTVSDRVAAAVAGATGQPESRAAALMALQHLLDEPSVDRLRQVLGLTASGTVRLVDRLEEAGYAERAPGRDARSVSVRLTPSGRAAAQRVAEARGAALEAALAGLRAADREQLDELLATVLTGLMRGPGATRWMCRMCDTRACGRDAGRCPVLNANRAARSGRARLSRSAGGPSRGRSSAR